jgi:trehalose utilization protein
VKTRISVIVWNEFRHERENAAVGAIYPEGLHTTIAYALASTPGLNPGALPLDIATATLDEPEHGLSEERLAQCDVLVWWGHKVHNLVMDEVVDRVQKRVLEGMGLIVLHSGHFSKIFRRMMGTNCSLKWREAHEKERLWVVEPSHPIAAGLGEYFELPNEEVFRSGCCWERGHGRIFYFRPGHEAYPTYHDKNVQRVIANAVQWAAPRVHIVDVCPNAAPLETISPKTGFTSVGIIQSNKDLA